MDLVTMMQNSFFLSKFELIQFELIGIELRTLYADDAT